MEHRFDSKLSTIYIAMSWKRREAVACWNKKNSTLAAEKR